ncbi:MAG TPA: Rieske 2Fe-2S domain-containing protein [Planctomycetota bacterium]|nr:Rieske 2Fe-2S domain-containing protein [Planctomycetota bacterium]
MKGIRDVGEQFVHAIEQQTWLDGMARPLQKALGFLFGGMGAFSRGAKNVASGKWLGHPVHPAITDVPIGSWAAAVALDTVDAASGGSRPARDAAHLATVVGCCAAIPTALTGAHDWQYLDGETKRIGLVHALFNSGALAAFGASLAMRKPGMEKRARAARCAGITLAVAGAYLGGHLVYRRRIGVDRSDHRQRPRTFVPVLDDSELREGEPKRVVAERVPIVLVRHNGGVYALGERCAHLGGPLSEGELKGDSIVCPWHGSRFALADGRVLEGPATADQPCFETRVRDGKIEVRWVESRELQAAHAREHERQREIEESFETRTEHG